MCCSFSAYRPVYLSVLLAGNSVYDVMEISLERLLSAMQLRLTTLGCSGTQDAFLKAEYLKRNFKIAQL